MYAGRCSEYRLQTFILGPRPSRLAFDCVNRRGTEPRDEICLQLPLSLFHLSYNGLPWRYFPRRPLVSNINLTTYCIVHS